MKSLWEHLLIWWYGEERYIRLDKHAQLMRQQYVDGVAEGYRISVLQREQEDEEEGEAYTRGFNDGVEAAADEWVAQWAKYYRGAEWKH